MLFYVHTHTTIPSTKCPLVSPEPKHSSAINIPQREISIKCLFVCVKLFHSSIWPYKIKINVHIRPIHFCVASTHFLHAVCIGRMNGTHEGTYTIGWGPVFLALSVITIISFSPGSLPKKSLLHCRFIQCRLFFFFLLKCHTQLVETFEIWRKKTATIFMVYICL